MNEKEIEALKRAARDVVFLADELDSAFIYYRSANGHSFVKSFGSARGGVQLSLDFGEGHRHDAPPVHPSGLAETVSDVVDALRRDGA